MKNTEKFKKVKINKQKKLKKKIEIENTMKNEDK